jgi:hypothetical protein
MGVINVKNLYKGCLLAAGLATSVCVLAQEEAPANLADEWTLAPKKGHAMEFEAALKEHMKFRAEQGEPRDWQVYQPIVGEKLNYYLIYTCCYQWEDFDAHRAWGREREAVAKHFEENVAPHVDHAHHYFYELDLENSNWPEEDDHFKYFGVTTWMPEPGEMGIDKMKTEFSQAAMEGKMDGNWVWMWRMGGTPQLGVVSPYANFADMKEPERTLGKILAEKLGSEEKAMEMFADFGDMFETSSYTLLEHRPDLSMPED